MKLETGVNNDLELKIAHFLSHWNTQFGTERPYRYAKEAVISMTVRSQLSCYVGQKHGRICTRMLILNYWIICILLFHKIKFLFLSIGGASGGSEAARARWREWRWWGPGSTAKPTGITSYRQGWKGKAILSQALSLIQRHLLVNSGTFVKRVTWIRFLFKQIRNTVISNLIV